MTRTARAAYPHALNKDRSEAKNGMDKRIPKRGAGPHNWGSLDDELELESAALEDEEADREAATGVVVNDAAAEAPAETQARPVPARRGSVLSDQEIREGMEVRRRALKSPDVDLGSIARSAPVLSSSPERSVPVVTDAETAAVKA